MRICMVSLISGVWLHGRIESVLDQSGCSVLDNILHEYPYKDFCFSIYKRLSRANSNHLDCIGD